MPIAPGSSSGSNSEGNPESTGGQSSDAGRWSGVTVGTTAGPTPVSHAPAEKATRRFSGVHLAITGVSSLLVGVLATTLAFTAFGSDSDGDASAAPAVPNEPVDRASSPDDDEQDEGSGPQDETIRVGEGYIVSTSDGTEVDVTVHEFSVDEGCRYGQDARFAEKTEDSRIVQLTIDVENLGGETYFIDELESLSAEGYTQPVETAHRWCDEPDDGASSWWSSSLIDNGQKRLLYGAFEVQPDAEQLVLAGANESRMLMDIPAPEEGSEEGAGAPEPTGAAG